MQRSDKKTGKSSVDTRYFISSPSSDVAVLGKAIRGHWSIENNFHWTLDVAFNEDLCRTPKEHSAWNLAMIRRALINLLKRDPLPRSIKRKRFQALINPD